MTTPPDDALEQLLRTALQQQASAAPDHPDPAGVRGRAATRRRRRRFQAAGLATTVLVLTSGTAAWVASLPPPSETAHSFPVVLLPVQRQSGPMTGTLLLPLTGSVEAGALPLGSRSDDPGTRSLGGAQAAAADGAFSAGHGAAVPDDQTIDVPPGTGQTLDRLAMHISHDGVAVSTFYTPSPLVSGGPTFRGPPVATRTSPSAPSPRPKHRTSPAGSCTPSGVVTIEASDTRAVGTFTEPFYGGVTTPLVDVEIGEIGVAEGSPATWVEAQVGPDANEVVVDFADGSTDAAAPAGGVAVLAHLGNASTTLGDGSDASLEVLGSGGAVLARYALGVAAPPARPATSPNRLPEAGARQPANLSTARDAVEQALAIALSCSEPPVAQSQVVYDGGVFEELGGAGRSGLASGDRVVADDVVFTGPTSAVVRYQVAQPGVTHPQVLYADAALVNGAWLLSLASVAPRVQLTPANGDGDVAVAPGGPIFVHASAGVAIAVYRAAPAGASGDGCGAETCSGQPTPSDCLPTGGVVEEVTTPGAVAIVAAPLFGRYTSPLIGVGLSIVGEAEGSPATVLAVETGPAAEDVSLTTRAGTDSVTPVDGVADSVLAGAPLTAIGAPGATLTVGGAAGAVLATVPVQVDSSEPAGASTLPSSLPAPGSGTAPADPHAATAAIEQVFSTVFGCADAPFARAGDIEDNGMFTNPVEQLYLGPYASLVESVYATVEDVVFVSPTLADVSYTIRFHDDPSLDFPMLGTAVLSDGSWRVSYATVCRAVALGGVQCSS